MATRSRLTGLRGSWLLPAVLEVYFGLWALDLPVIFAAVTVPLGELRSDGEASLECKNGESYDDQPTCAQASQK